MDRVGTQERKLTRHGPYKPVNGTANILFLDLDDPDIVRDTSNAASHGPSTTLDKGENTTCAVSPTGSIMQGLTICNSLASSTLPRTGFDSILGTCRTASLKRKLRSGSERVINRPKEATGTHAALDHYLSAEKTKHERLSIEFPTRTYVLPYPMKTKSIIAKDEHLNIARNLFAAVGSSESLVLLQACIVHRKDKLPEEGVDPLRPLSLLQRIKTIECLGRNIAYYALLWWYHIRRPYTEHAPTQLSQEHSFIVNTDEQCFSKSRRGPGNAQYGAAAEIILAMSEDSYASASELSRRAMKAVVYLTN
ncbi:hypothetical protein GQ44DRAFT_818499 [Phaeosphaeriaceae sp. PMI808]|nr:hypothetical protein GQ44DRAFT_818499 [Phaeosphaeriaceae sp. PMI808]